MFMGGIAEILILILGGGGLGIPVGIPPGPENPLMAQVAPEKCLFYTTWSPSIAIDPQKNATEKWMAQPEIQASYEKLKTALDAHFARYKGEEEYETQLTGALYNISKLALTRSAAMYLTEVKLEDTSEMSVRGGVLIDLGDQAAEINQTLIAGCMKLVEEFETDLRTFQVAGSECHEMVFPDSEQVLSWTVHEGRYLMFGFGPGALQSMSDNLATPAPQWLADLRAKLPVERVASVSYVDGTGLAELIGQVPEPDFTAAMDILGFTKIKQLSWVTGLDDQGYIMRTGVETVGPPAGLLSLVDLPPLNAKHLNRIPDGKMVTAATRLSSENLMKIIKGFSAMAPGMVIEDQITALNQAAGIDFEHDVLQQMSDHAFLYGSVSMINPWSGWVLGIGVKSDLAFDTPYQNVVTLIKKSVEEEGFAKIEESVVEGHTVYSYNMEDAFMPFSYAWTFSRGELLLSLDETSLRRHLRRKTNADDRWIEREEITELLKPVEAGGTGPVLLTSVDMAQVLQIGTGVLEMINAQMMTESEFGFSVDDLPPIKVLTNGLKPNFSAMYRTERGFEMLQRQTFPGGSPAGLVGSAAMFGAPAVFSTRREAARVNAANRIRQVALAMHNYHDANRALPAQFSKDAEGKPLLSWRVHILPYLGQSDLYDQFHLDEPWDSEHNKTLIDQMPDVYVHTRVKLEDGKTVFVVPVGEGAVFGAPEKAYNKEEPNPVGTSLEAIRDGTSRTILVLEANSDHAVTWTKPEDYSWGDLPSIAEGLKGTWPNGIQAAFCDGSVQMLKLTITEETLKHLLQMNDGNAIDPDSFR